MMYVVKNHTHTPYCNNATDEKGRTVGYSK